MKPWRRIEPTTVTKVGWRTITTKTFIDNRGVKHLFDTSGTEGAEGVAVIALTDDDQVIIARQFRAGPEIICEELPGGNAEKGEDRVAAMRRELQEETGYQADSLEYLGHYPRSPYSTQLSHVFLATGCKKVSDQQLDDVEDITVCLISISQLIDNAKCGNMTDASAVLMAYDKLMEIQENA